MLNNNDLLVRTTIGTGLNYRTPNADVLTYQKNIPGQIIYPGTLILYVGYALFQIQFLIIYSIFQPRYHFFD